MNTDIDDCQSGITTVQAGRLLHCSRPSAFARIHGDCGHEELSGYVLFYEAGNAVLAVADIHGLPIVQGGRSRGIYAVHIHAGGSCTGDENDAFADSDGHFDIGCSEHPYHSGDMPPLFSDNGNAWSAFATSRFSVNDIIGRTVIIHAGKDDFTSQPAGNAGAKIGCGVIYKNA